MSIESTPRSIIQEDDESLEELEQVTRESLHTLRTAVEKLPSQETIAQLFPDGPPEEIRHEAKVMESAITFFQNELGRIRPRLLPFLAKIGMSAYLIYFATTTNPRSLGDVSLFHFIEYLSVANIVFAFLKLILGDDME